MTRIALTFILPLTMLGACNVQKDEQNDTTEVSFNQEAAESGLEAAGNEAEKIGGIIVNDVKETGDKVQNEVGDVDVDVDVNADKDGNAAANGN